MEYQRHTLSNGLRIITVPMPHLESVTVMVAVGAGSRHEEKKVAGLAHFVEHMAFKGTKKRPNALAISSEFDSLGAQYNAFTDKELVVYHSRTSSKNLPQIADILTDIVFNSTYNPADIEKESGVILEELRMYRDAPKSWVFDLYLRLLFGDHPLGWDTIGTKGTIQKIKREDFLSYFERWYHPQNLVVAVAGKFEQTAVLEQLGGILSGLASREGSEELKYQSLQSQPQILLSGKKTDQTHFVLGTHAYARGHPDREKLDVLTVILGEGMSSRLFQAIRVQRGLAYYVGAEWASFADVGEFAIHAGVNRERFEEALSAALEELKKIKEVLVSEEELRRAKEMIRGDLVLGLESTRGACSYFLFQELLEQKIETPQEKMAKIEAVTAGDLQKVANDLFSTAHLNLAAIGPFTEKDRERLLNLLKL